MSQINPNTVINEEYFVPSPYSKVQQVGIDVSLKLPEGKESLRLFPGNSYNLEINESVYLPNDIYATINIRSSFSRQGVFQSSGIYDPGFHGTCGLTLYNMADHPIEIKANERIAQMLFFKADAASTYDGHYNHTESVTSQYDKKGE